MPNSIGFSMPSMAISPPPNRTVQDALDHVANLASSSGRRSPIGAQSSAACSTKAVAAGRATMPVDDRRRSASAIRQAGRSHDRVVLHYDEINSMVVQLRGAVAAPSSNEGSVSQSACYRALLGGVFVRRVDGMQSSKPFGMHPKGHFLEVGLMLKWGVLSKKLGRDCDRDRLDDARGKTGKFITALCHETSLTMPIYRQYHFSDNASKIGGPSNEKVDMVGFICGPEALTKHGLQEMASNVRELGIRAANRGDGPAMQMVTDLITLQFMDVLEADAGTHGLAGLNRFETEHRESLSRARAFNRQTAQGLSTIKTLPASRISAGNSDIHKAKMMGWRQAAEQVPSVPSAFRTAP